MELIMSEPATLSLPPSIGPAISLDFPAPAGAAITFEAYSPDTTPFCPLTFDIPTDSSFFKAGRQFAYNLAKSGESMAHEVAGGILNVANRITQAGCDAASGVKKGAIAIGGAAKDVVNSKNKLQSVATKTDGVYKAAKLGKYLSMGAEHLHTITNITGKVRETAGTYMDFVDGIGIVDDIASIANGSLIKKLKDGQYYDFTKSLINMIGVNVPCTLLLFDKLDIMKLGAISQVIGIALETSIVPFIRSTVVILMVTELYDGVQEIRKGHTTKGLLVIAAATAEMALQIFYLAGCTSVPGLVVLGVLSASMGIAKWVYTEGQKESAKGILQTAEGLNNVTKLASSVVDTVHGGDLSFLAMYLPMLEECNPTFHLINLDCKSISEVLTVRNIFDRIIRYKKEIAESPSKFFFLTLANLCQFGKGLGDHGVEFFGKVAGMCGNYPILGTVAGIGFKKAGSGFMLIATLIAIGQVSKKMWEKREARKDMRNIIALTKDIGKVGLIVFSGSLGFLKYAGSPGFIAFAIAANSAALAKTVYDVKYPKTEPKAETPVTG